VQVWWRGVRRKTQEDHEATTHTISRA
jgi:hypothetical protein